MPLRQRRMQKSLAMTTKAINTSDGKAFDKPRKREQSMMCAPLPRKEKARLEALRLYGVQDAKPKEPFDELTCLAAQICSAPVALLSIVESDRVWYKSKVGTRSTEMSREEAFCSWAILQPGIFVVADALKDSRFKDNPLVSANPGIRFYAAAPLLTSEGHALGTLCVIDYKPRDLTAAQAAALRTLAAAAVRQLEFKRSEKELQHAKAEREQALDALAASEERYNLITRSANDGLWDWNLEMNEIRFCPRWKAMLGYKEDEIGVRPDEWFSRVHPQDIELLQEEIISHLLGLKPHFSKEHRMRKQDGTYRWMLSRGMAVWDSNRQVYRMAGSVTDITDHKEAEQRLLHNATHDVLTGLPNRALFMDRLKRLFDRARHDNGHLFAVLFLDLDRFKIVNDSLGHQIGDQLLVALARRLDGSLRPGDMVARLGGDEFAIILDHLKHISDATQAAERIHKELCVPFNLSGHEVFASVSIGIAHSHTPYEQPEDFIRNADTAMYRAKDQGRGRFELFDKDMHVRAVALLELETDLRRALARGEFCVHYQPIVSIENWRIAGFEALLRWQHPEQGFISPSKFIPVAEETGLINQIGQWVFREACKQLRAWQIQYPSDTPLTISVNLSAKQFSHPTLIEDIKQILTETNVSPSSLKIEITESAIIENIDLATEILRQLKAIGIRISLDDFGTGYSSLSYLHRFPIDTLKIDRSFVTRMSMPKNSEIVRTIITLAVNLGMDVIAEGVETREQIILLTGLNCEYVQGFLLSKPVDGETMRELIEQTYQKGLNEHAEAVSRAFATPVDFEKGLANEKGLVLASSDPDALEYSSPFERQASGAQAGNQAESESRFSTSSQETLNIQTHVEQQSVYTESSSKSTSKNRRRCERFKLSLPARITGYDRRNGKWNEMAQTADVSRTGVTLSLNRRVRHGSVLHLTLPLPPKLRTHGYSDSSYRVYALVRRIEPFKDGVRMIGLEFVGENPPTGYLEKPWATFHTRKWTGAGRRREPREEKTEIVAVEYLTDSLESIGQEFALSENRSRSGMRLRLQKATPEFDLLRIYGPEPHVQKIAAVCNRYVGSDGFERLCLRFTGKKGAVVAAGSLS
jgi:diguanylate cyclase (GGDEF)-like protein/PAS domain S-box-containing protein